LKSGYDFSLQTPSYPIQSSTDILPLYSYHPQQTTKRYGSFSYDT
jgi:hypothetical protein